MDDLLEKVLYNLKLREEGNKTLPENASDRTQEKHDDDRIKRLCNEYELLEESIYSLNETRIIDKNTDIGSGRSFFGVIKSTGKKIIRKCIKWYIDPMKTQQMEFNANTITAVERIRDICERFEAISKSYYENRAFIYAMNAKFEDSQFVLNQENDRLQNLCNELQNELNELKNKS